MSLKKIWGEAAGKLLIVGLTGGIASGKTEVALEFARLGAKVIDADEVARDVVLPGTSAYHSLVEAFGEGILAQDGAIDRAALADRVFADERKLKKLNRITHPAIFAEIARRVSDYARLRRPEDVPAVIIDAALIVDVGAAGVFDVLVVVSAEGDTRLGRLVERRSMSEEEARGRIASQVSDEKRLEMADILIRNDSSLEELKENVALAWTEIARRAGEARGQAW